MIESGCGVTPQPLVDEVTALVGWQTAVGDHGIGARDKRGFSARGQKLRRDLPYGESAVIGIEHNPL